MAKQKKNSEPQQDPFEDRDLAFDPLKQSYALDVDDIEPDYDHPSDYNTVAEGAEDDDSTYDNSNPYVGDEYADLDELHENSLEQNDMHIEGKLKLSAIDKILAQTAEDARDDLDEEGYPKNDQ